MQKLDRRIIRTRALLRDALLTLIAEKGYDSLTIQDITDRANLRRATFYEHYHDKEALLLTVLEESFDALVHDVEAHRAKDVLAGKTKMDTFLAAFKHTEQHYEFYRAILTGQSGAVIARRIREYLASVLLKTLPQEGLSVPRDALANYIAGAEMALITWWLENGMPYPAEQMASLAHHMTLDGARGILGELLPSID